MGMMKNKQAWQGLMVAVSLVVGALPSRGDTVDNARRVEEKKREILDEVPLNELGHTAHYSFESGGWLNYRLADYDEYDKDRTTADVLTRSLRSDVRVWGRITRRASVEKDADKEYVYIRIKDIYTEKQGSAPGARFDDRGPLVDYAYVGVDHKPWKIEVGRRYFNIGKGIAYSGVHDGIQVNHQQPGWNIAAFLSKLPPHTENLDTSIPGYDKESRRYFVGTGVGYAGIKGHQLYSYAVMERDHSKEKPADDVQDYGYDAEYYGAGAKGEWTKAWPYWVEVIRETGHSREYPSNAVSNISAWAFDAEQKFVLPWASRLTFSAEAAAGSGDNDRIDPTNTIYGNAAGRDHGFNYFGYLPTGAALNPSLSNLRMLRAGVDAYPFYRINALRKILAGVDYFHYWKDRADGGFSDVYATESRRDIGQEIDLHADWWVTKKVLCSVEWGVFMPGKAYDRSHRSQEDVVALSMSVIF
jgi:hypothetical protein